MSCAPGTKSVIYDCLVLLCISSPVIESVNFRPILQSNEIFHKKTRQAKLRKLVFYLGYRNIERRNRLYLKIEWNCSASNNAQTAPCCATSPQQIKPMKFERSAPAAPTSETMMDVDVDELCTRTVTRTPIMRPHTGLWKTLNVNRLPVVRPARRPRHFVHFRFCG